MLDPATDITDYRQVIAEAKRLQREHAAHIARLLAAADRINDGVDGLLAADQITKNNAERLRLDLFGKLLRG